ncbi:uncharacterized protein METZ01_LOCUS485056 [marine metagenome]|uniref:Uncharacterized protein n=1 Tax=marine metagenome TaxID=408172 RepID=A0A383CJ26_9ZZZZ
MEDGLLVKTAIKIPACQRACQANGDFEKVDALSASTRYTRRGDPGSSRARDSADEIPWGAFGDWIKSPQPVRLFPDPRLI